MKPNFISKTFFGENVAYDPAQRLVKAWCPYLYWVLRNLPHKFEKVANITKSVKKNITIWASRNACAPKTSQYGHLAKLVPQNHRRDGMSRLGSSRNVQWSTEGVTNSLCSRAHNLVNLSGLR